MLGNKFASDELAASFQKNIIKIKSLNEKNYKKIVKEAADSSMENHAESFLVDENDSEDHHSSSIDDTISSLADDGESCNMCGYAHDGACNEAGDGAISSESFDERNSLQAKDARASYVVGKLTKIAKGLQSKGKLKAAAVVINTANSIRNKDVQNLTISDDHSLNHDKRAKYVVKELTKIAHGLKSKGESQAAAVVTKTASSIREDSLSERNRVETTSSLISNKERYVISELSKIASELRYSGSGVAADLVTVTNNAIQGEAYLRAASKYEVVSGLVKMAQESYSSGDAFSGDVIQVTINKIVNEK
jgi:hypothetical protein